MNKVCVNLKTRFKYFHYCHFEGKMIDQNKVLLDEPLNCIIKVKDEDVHNVPIPIPNKNWKIGQKVLINQCYDGYWSWWEATIIGRFNSSEWIIKYDNIVNVEKFLIAKNK